MRMILSDAELADRIAGNGCSYVQEYMSEKIYLDKYRAMIRSVSKSGEQGDDSMANNM